MNRPLLFNIGWNAPPYIEVKTMKKKIIIEIETDEKSEIVPLEELDGSKEHTPAELEKFKKEYAEDLAKDIVKRIKKFVEERLPEEFMDDAEELYVENWDDWKDYPITIKYEEQLIK